MKYRIAQMQDKVDVLTTNPPAEDLSFSDIVSRLSIKLSIKNDAAAETFLDHPAASLTDVEIIDGSEVLVSLSGKRLLGMNYWDKDGKIFTKNTSQYDQSSRMILDIDFGRTLWDEKLGFDSSKFSNPQLKLTFDDTKVQADAITELNYDLYAYLFDEKVPAPSGFIMRKEVESWTPTANAWHTVVMPTDYTYRQAFIYGFGTEKGIGHAVEEFVLSENLDKRKPLEIYTKDLQYLLRSKYSAFREWFEAHNLATTFYVATSEDVRVQVSQNIALAVGGTAAGNKVTITPAAGGSIATGHTYGYNPMHMIPILIHDQHDMDDWYDVTALDNLKLKCRAKNETMASPEAGVYLEQYRTY